MNRKPSATSLPLTHSRAGHSHKFSGGFELTTYKAAAADPATPDHAHARVIESSGYPLKPLGSPSQEARWEALLGKPLRHIEPDLVEVTQSRQPRRSKGVAGPSLSPNWSGIELFPEPGRRLVSVAGRWVVPSVLLPYSPKGSTTFMAASWVGIDGDGSADVFQAGVTCTIQTTNEIPNTFYSYGAWWEWYPHLWVNINNFPISPGDTVMVLLTANFEFQTLMFEAVTVFDLQPPNTGFWCMADCDKDGKADLVFIKTANTPSGKVEVHIASAKSKYQKFFLETATVFDLQPPNTGFWCMADCDKDGKADLVFIKTANTPSGKVEVHIASAKSKYQKFFLETATVFDLQPPNTGTWVLADCDGDGKADLVFIKTADTASGKVEVYIASAKSKYQELFLQKETVLDLQPPDTGTWCMADFDKDGKAELIFVKNADTPSGNVEVHIASAKSQYQNFILEVSTAFPEQALDTGTWCMADFDADKIADLVFVKTFDTTSGKVEVYVASGNPGQSGSVVFRNETRGLSTAFEFKAPSNITLAGNCAEWIVERPDWDGNPTALPNYEIVVFTDGSATDNAGTVFSASEGTEQDGMTQSGLVVSMGSVNDRNVVCVYTGRGSFFQHLILETPTAFSEQPPGTGNWLLADYTKHGEADLIFVKTADTPAAKVEVHIASAKSKYQKFFLETATVFDLQPPNTGFWCMADCDKDGKADLVFIKTANTPNGKVEVHIASAKSKYQKFFLETATVFDLQPPNTGFWCMADCDKDGKADLVFIKTANTPSGKVEVHIASAKSKYQKFFLETATVFDLQPSDAGTWFMADFDRDGKADLIFIKTANTTILDGKVEVYIASSKTKYQELILELPTVFDLQPPNTGTWVLADCNNDGAIDLEFIKTVGTPGGNVELHVASGNFQP